MTDDANQDLVARVTREVVRRIREDGSQRVFQGPTVAIACSLTTSADALRGLTTLADRGYGIAGVACGRGAPSALRDAARELTDRVACGDGDISPLPEGVGALVLPELGLADATKIALAMPDDIVPLWAWYALDGDLPVIASEGIGFVVPGGGPRERLATLRRSTCRQFGIEWTPADGLASAVAARVVSDDRSDTLHVPSGDRRPLVTEEMVDRLAAGTREIVLPDGAVLTPLAGDALRRRGVTVRRRG